MIYYTWQQVSSESHSLFSTTCGLFKTHEEARAFFSLPPDTPIHAGGIIRLGLNIWHLTLINTEPNDG